MAKGKRILVSGASGFVGSHTVEALVKRGHEVAIIDNLKTGHRENVAHIEGVRDSAISILDFTGMHRFFKDFRPQGVIHLAAQPAISVSKFDPAGDALTNIVGTVSLLNLMQSFETEAFVFASTSAVYNPMHSERPLKEIMPPGPDSPYGLSKLAAETYIRYFNPNGFILRYGNVYGPRQRPVGENQLVPRAIRHLLEGEYFEIYGDGTDVRDYVYVEDVAAANVAAIEAAFLSSGVEVANVASGMGYSVLEVLSAVISEAGLPEYNFTHGEKREDRPSIVMNCENAATLFNWKAGTPLETGIHKTWDWWKGRVEK